ncbi:hypothetical protein LLE49_00610 [Alicyclobacillus tolerans]|uniref:hypothetical protein n=1 Tax=Alicyclobacillus tolerans TaxID=90970 RepID=UPI001F33FD6E|nr:hypothetical protein [Alicyclobacillus tolerans]MCF8563245.1 hypothetical protein [Alicyclobacillus tolerans]
MTRTGGFRAGQRVRIRPSADSDFAGCEGTVVYVGETVCDVKITVKKRGSKAGNAYIRAFSKRDLERVKRKIDLVSLSVAPGGDPRTRVGWVIAGVACLCVLAWIVWSL